MSKLLENLAVQGAVRSHCISTSWKLVRNAGCQPLPELQNWTLQLDHMHPGSEEHWAAMPLGPKMDALGSPALHPSISASSAGTLYLLIRRREKERAGDSGKARRLLA